MELRLKPYVRSSSKHSTSFCNLCTTWVKGGMKHWFCSCSGRSSSSRRFCSRPSVPCMPQRRSPSLYSVRRFRFTHRSIRGGLEVVMDRSITDRTRRRMQGNDRPRSASHEWHFSSSARRAPRRDPPCHPGVKDSKAEAKCVAGRGEASLFLRAIRWGMTRQQFQFLMPRLFPRVKG